MQDLEWLITAFFVCVKPEKFPNASNLRGVDLIRPQIQKRSKTMNAKELIEKLQHVDPEAPVIIALDGEIREVTGLAERLCTLRLSFISAPIYTIEITFKTTNEVTSCPQP